MERTKQEITEAREKMRSAKQRGGGNNSGYYSQSILSNLSKSNPYSKTVGYSFQSNHHYMTNFRLTLRSKNVDFIDVFRLYYCILYRHVL